MSKPIWAQVELPAYFPCMGNNWANMGPSFRAVWVGPINEWDTANVLSNFWIKIQCPFPIFISKLQVRGRTNGNNPTLWRLDGSNNDSVWDALLSSNQKIIGTAISEYGVIQKPPVSYKFYRIFCIKRNGTNPGLSYIQFF